MLPWLMWLLKHWRAIGLAVFVALVAGYVWRSQVWRESHELLPIVQAELTAEKACQAGSQCAKAVEARVAAAEQAAALRASEAVSGAYAREEAARRDAAAWREKLARQKATDPDCKAWSEAPIRCEL